MSDLEKLLSLFKEWDIPYTQEGMENEFDKEIFIAVGDYDGKCEESPNVKGYCGFFTGYTFDTNGKFKSMGAWE